MGFGQENYYSINNNKLFIVYLPIPRLPLLILPSIKILCDSADDSVLKIINLKLIAGLGSLAMFSLR